MGLIGFILAIVSGCFVFSDKNMNKRVKWPVGLLLVVVGLLGVLATLFL